MTLSEQLQRYDKDGFPDDDGIWVEYTDVQTRIKELEGELAGMELMDAEGDSFAEDIVNQNKKLQEFYEASCAVEEQTLDFDLHNDAVERLRKAKQAVEENE